MKGLRATTVLVAAMAFAGSANFAQGFPAEATISLVARDGSKTRIGTVRFGEASGGMRGFAVDLDGEEFSEHFLSMRPFRCITGDTEWYCHLPYPYDLRGTVSGDDLTDLEYSLLFIRKLPSEFGIDAWNGLYYDLVLNADGTISGRLLEGDLNVLASPPGEPLARPIDTGSFIEGDSSKRSFPEVVIE